jgi:hypothetical protein
MNDQIDHAAATFEDATQRYQGIAPNLEAQAELSAIQLLATAALVFAPDATHLLMESSDQGNYMCTPHGLMRDGRDLLEYPANGTEGREAEWMVLCDQYNLEAAASWLTWGHDAWERFVDTDHPYTRKRAGYMAISLLKVKGTL